MDNENNYDLTEEQWLRIAPMLPPERTGKKGRPRNDNRKMLNGMLWINHSGAQWRAEPKRYGPWSSVYARFAKWVNEGLWERIFAELNQDADTENLVLTQHALKSMRALTVGKKLKIRLSDAQKAD